MFRSQIILTLLLFCFTRSFSQLSPEQKRSTDSLYRLSQSSVHDTVKATCLVEMSELMYIAYVDTLVPLCNRALSISEKNLAK